MKNKLENENLIQKFLFGEMMEQERLEFEERFILDTELFDEIKVVEDELIEKYVRGWMSVAESSKFEKSFLTTKKRRERVEFSRQLIDKTQEQKEIVAVKKNDEIISEESVWQKLANLFLTPKIAMATAFTLLVVVFGSWFLYQNSNNGKPEIVKNQNSNVPATPKQIITPTPEITPDELPQNSENINNKNENFNENSIKKTPTPTPTPKESNQKVEKTPTPTKTPVPRSAPNPVLALFAGTSRSGGKNNVLNLPKEANAATLQLNVEAIDYKTYQAQLTDANGNVIFQRANLKPGKTRINFNIPANKLKRGDYIIKLFGTKESGENESVADFQFRVQH